MIKPLELMFCINSMLGLQSEASKMNVRLFQLEKNLYISGFSCSLLLLLETNAK